MDKLRRSEPVRQAGRLTVALVLSLALMGLVAGGASAARRMTVARAHHGRVVSFKRYHAAHMDGHKRAARHWLARFRYWRNQEFWTRKYRALPSSTKAMLARLRGCETRGIAFPRNYHYTGAHDGAYQYVPSTWHRAGGRQARASYAVPHEQDVRTARFYPSHRGEWACSA